MKYFRPASFFFSIVLLQCTISAQPPVASPLPVLSEKLTRALNRTLENGDPDSARRTAALTDLLKAQRHLWTADRQQTLVENVELRNAAKTTLITALDKDPTLAEAYTMLAELELTSQSQNVSEALAFTELATRANPANFGGLRLKARILTRLTKMTEADVDRNLVVKAISAWNQVVKLDPLNAEALAFLSRLYEANGEPEQQIAALQKWTGAPVPAENGFYRAVMGRDAELTPETASLTLAAVLIKNGRTEEAIDIVIRILIDDPDNRQAARIATGAIDSAPKAGREKIAEKLRSALSSNPGNKALISLVERISLSRT